MTKSKKLIFLLLLVACVLALGLSGCNGNVFVVSEIKVQTPCKNVYILGENLDVTGGVLEVKYSNGATALVPFADERVSFSELDKTKPGVQMITIRFDTQSTFLSVTVTDVAEKIEIASLPSKRSYIQGEAFNVKGLTIKISYVGGTSAVITATAEMVTGYNAEEVGEQTLTVSLANNGQTFTAEFAVTVSAKAVTGFFITEKPKKVNYKLGAELELSDAVFRITYNNNTPLYAHIAKRTDGTYGLTTADGVALAGSATIWTKSGNGAVAGFQNDTEGNKEIFFYYEGNYAYGLTVKVVREEIAEYQYSGEKAMVKGTPSDRIVPLFLSGVTIKITFRDLETHTFTLPADYDNGKVLITGYVQESSEDKQTLYFDFGSFGMISIEFAMTEKSTEELLLKESGDHDLSGGTLTFYTGDTLDISGWIFTLTYNNGTSEDYNAKKLGFRTDSPDANDNARTFSFGTVGTFTVTLDHQGLQNYSFTIVVLEKTLSELVIEKNPDVTEYSVNDTVNFQGIVLKAYYADENGIVVRSRSVAVYPDKEFALGVTYDNTVAGTANVALTLVENKVSATAVFTVNFKAVVQSISVENSENCKRSYILGESFNPNGLVMTIHYIGAEPETVVFGQNTEGTAWTFTPSAFTVLGAVSLKIGYLGKEVSLNNIIVHNDIVAIRLKDAAGNLFEAGATVGSVTVDILVNLAGYTLIAEYERAGDVREFELPSAEVTVFADNSASFDEQKKLEVRVTYSEKETRYFLDRKAREHLYYQLDGSLKNLQTILGFDPTGLTLTEYFNNGTKQLLNFPADYSFAVPALEIPDGGKHITLDVGIKTVKNGNSNIEFHYGTNQNATAIPVTFYKRVAKTLTKIVNPADTFKIKQGTAGADVLSLFANANDGNTPVTLHATYSDGTAEDIVLKDHLADFTMTGYDENIYSNTSVKLFYGLGKDLFVEYVLHINPKELYDIAFEGYLIGAQGTAEQWFVVQGTDIDYTHASLKVRYAFYEGSSGTPFEILLPVSIPIQKEWSSFVKGGSYTDGQEVAVIITYTYKFGRIEKQLSVSKNVTMIAKSVSEVSIMKPPKSTFVEGEKFTFMTASDSGEYGVLRVGYNNGTYDSLSLSPENESLVASNDPTKFFVVSNGYTDTELNNGDSRTYTVHLQYMGRDVSYQIVLKDRAYVDFRYETEGSADKIYGNAAKIALTVFSGATVVSDGARAYAFRDGNGRVFSPEGDGFTFGGTVFRYLPAGNYTIAATYDGVKYRYNPAVKDIGSLNVSKRVLTLSYGEVPGVIYGDASPDFLSYLQLQTAGFADGEDISVLTGAAVYTAYLNGALLSSPPKNATSVDSPYRLGVTGLSSENYQIIFPGEGENSYGTFAISRRPVFIIPTEQTVVYGDIVPTVPYTAYVAEGGELLSEQYVAELIGSPTVYEDGTALSGTGAVRFPNAGKYELNVAVMQSQNLNFEITVKAEKYVTLNKAALTVGYNEMTATYGDELTFDRIAEQLEIGGWKRNDEGNVAYDVSFAINGGGNYLTGADFLLAVKDAGEYTLLAGGMTFDNYVVDTYSAGTYKVQQKDVAVTPRGAAKEYGTADPVFGYDITGLIGTDALTGALSRAVGENVIVGGYAIQVGTLGHKNYRITLVGTEAVLKITKRELILTVATENLRKFYDGHAPSIAKYSLNLVNGGAVADDKVYIPGTAPDRSKILLTFSSNSPDRTSTTSPLSVFLGNSDLNHSIVLAKEYKYAINRLPVEVEWLKIPIAGGEGVPFQYGSAYPYRYNQKHYITARVKAEGLVLNPDRIEDMSVTLSSAFYEYYDSVTGTYGLPRAATYNPTVDYINNQNFEISSGTSTKGTSITVSANTVYVEIAEDARSKFYDRTNATVKTSDVSKIRLYEGERDGLGAAMPGGTRVEITDVDYKTAVLRIINFTVGNKAGGVADVATDSSDKGYAITMGIADPVLGANFNAVFSDETSQRYFIKPRPIKINVFSGISKTYDGDAPFISSGNLSSSDATYVTASQLQDMLNFTPKNADMTSGDVGLYSVGVNTEKFPNYEFGFTESYTYTITKKEIYVALTSGANYYLGEKQLTLTSADVKARDNNLGKNDRWEDVFQSLRFSFAYSDNLGHSALSVGNASGERGNVGVYAVTLSESASVHKNYTFRWFGETSFAVNAAEVSVLPTVTSLVYGDSEEGLTAPYRKSYTVRFSKGSDGSVDGSIFMNLDEVINHLLLDRDNATAFGVSSYNIVLGADWVNTYYQNLPNYNVSLARLDGTNKFQITKRPLTVRIEDYHKTFGTAITNADIVVLFPERTTELKFEDTLELILSGYQITASGSGYRFLANINYIYSYLGTWTSASTSPLDALANATRETNGAGGVFGYKMQFASFPFMTNYQIVYEAGAEGGMYIQPKTLNFTVADFEWVYRDAWKAADAGADETHLNFGNFFTVSGRINGDTTEIKYPVLDKANGFAAVLESLTKNGAGTSTSILRAWFNEAETNAVETNRNYVYNLEFDETYHATVKKATLNATVQTADGQSALSKEYGTLPSLSDLRISYDGFRGDDGAQYTGNPTSVIATPAKIPNFVLDLQTNGEVKTAVLYSVGTHKIAPDAREFSADNYILEVDTDIVDNPFLFTVTKKNLTVRSTPAGEQSGSEIVLRKFFGEALVRDSDYSVDFGTGVDGFITTVLLPDGTVADVADSADSVFYNRFPSAEWVSYDKSVNVKRNVPTATEIAPNIAYMNEVSSNYNVISVTGESLKLEIFNKISAVELALDTDGNPATNNDARYYGYVTNAAAGASKTIRVKITYIDGEVLFVNLPLNGTAYTVNDNDNHIVTLEVAAYSADSLLNQVTTLTVGEENTLGTLEGDKTMDEKIINVTLRNVDARDKHISPDDLEMTFVGAPLDARTTPWEGIIRMMGSSAAANARFNLVDISFLLMRSKGGVSSSFDFVIYNGATKETSTHRYTFRVGTGSFDGEQNIGIYEQAAVNGVFPSGVGSFIGYVGLGAIDFFDEETHSYSVYLDKLKNKILFILDGVYILGYSIRNGELTDQATVGFGLTAAYGYITNVNLSIEGYSAEDAPRVIAKSYSDSVPRIIALGNEEFARVRPDDYFKLLWNYNADFYHDGLLAPMMKFYIDGAETSPIGGVLSLGKGAYTFTAKVFRGNMELSSATVDLVIADGYYRDGYFHYNAEGVADEDKRPNTNTFATLSGGSGGKVYEGKQTSTAYSYYGIDIDSVQIGSTGTIDVNVKTSDPKTTAFNAVATDYGYTGLTLRIQKSGENYNTLLKLVAGDGTSSVRPDTLTTTAVDWSRKDGVYSVNVSFDKKNLYIRAEILFNGQSIHIFYIDGAIPGHETEQDAETAASKGATVNNLAVMREKAPVSWAIATLGNLATGHSVVLDRNTSLMMRRVEIGTHTDTLANYARTVSRIQNGTTTTTSTFDPHRKGGASDSMTEVGGEISYMISENNFAAPASNTAKASVNRYETYGIRFKVTSKTGGTNKLRFILAENAPKTAADAANRNTVKAMRNISLTFIKREGVTRMYFSFNDSLFNTGMESNEVGEVTNFRYEQELYRVADGEVFGGNKINLFDGQEHKIVVTFDRNDNNIDLSSGLVITQTLANYVRVYIDGVDFGRNFAFPAYNNISPWNYLDVLGNTNAQASQTTTPFYDRYFLDERTAAGVAFRGIDIVIYDLAVSEKKNQSSFLSGRKK